MKNLLTMLLLTGCMNMYAQKQDPMEFYVDCYQDYVSYAQTYDSDITGLVNVPELFIEGERIVLSFYQDAALIKRYSQDPVKWYGAINKKAYESGVIYAAYWHEAYGEITSGRLITEIKRDGTEKLFLPIARKSLGMDSKKVQDFEQGLMKEWMKMHTPYWKLKDARDYTFNATLASFQLGVSMELEKLGYK